MAIAVALAGCASRGQQVPKSGSSSVRTTVLRLEVVDAVDADRDVLVRDVAAVSRGALQLKVDGSDAYDSASPAQEAQLAADLRSGKAGFGYLAVRDLAAAGSTDFQAVDAPFVITTSAASQQFAASPLAASYLANLRSLGMTGIGMIPAEPRDFSTREPLVTAADFQGARIRIIDNPETAAMVSGLGAIPVQKLLSGQVNGQLRDGKIDGVESSPSLIRSNSYQSLAPYTTSYAAFPKLNVLAASTAAWSRLTATQQGWLRQAAAQALTTAATQVPLREGEALSAMCKEGTILVRPSESALSAIVARAQAATPSSAAVRAALVAIRSAMPVSGPYDQSTTLPPECTVASTAAQARAAHQRATGPAFQHRGGTQIPDGTYVITTTVADLRAGGQYGADWNQDIRWTTHLHNGQVDEFQQPDYPDQGPCSGTYVVRGDQVVFSWVGGGCDGFVETLRWSYYQGKLSFAIVDVADTASKVIYTAHPWQKVS